MSRLTLPDMAGAVLESLGVHRLLTARQIRRLHAPQAGSRWTEKVMARLVSAELVDYVHAGGGARRVYFLTAEGHRAVQAATATSPTPVREGRYLAGALSAHTLAVNDVGLAFVQAARARGDEFDAHGWRHEVAHPISAPGRGRRAELVIADALLTYQQHLPDRALAFHYRFLELDRATQPTAALAAKLGRYPRLLTYTTNKHKEPLWHRTYPVFPEVLVVLAGAPPAALRRRAETVLALCQADPLLQRSTQVAVSIVLLEELLEQGPWAPIFQRLHLDQPVTWTGEPS
jgi:hypothetical protein